MMKLRSTICGLALALVLAMPFATAQAEGAAARWSHRELPNYPVLLRGLKIGGHVKLVVTLDSEGKVTQATVRGGNPMLAELSCIAVKKWVRAGVPAESKVEVEFVFDPTSGVLLRAE
jgi:outer membrane biosynthesis protein TonB